MRTIGSVDKDELVRHQVDCNMRNLSEAWDKQQRKRHQQLTMNENTRWRGRERNEKVVRWGERAKHLALVVSLIKCLWWIEKEETRYRRVGVRVKRMNAGERGGGEGEETSSVAIVQEKRDEASVKMLHFRVTSIYVGTMQIIITRSIWLRSTASEQCKLHLVWRKSEEERKGWLCLHVK